MARKKDLLPGETLVLFENFGPVEPLDLTLQIAPPEEEVDLLEGPRCRGLVVSTDWIKLESADTKAYDMTRAGLYRFIAMGAKGVDTVRNRIKVNNLTERTSLLALVSGLSKLHVHGTIDQGTGNPDTWNPDTWKRLLWEGKPGKSFLSLQCGCIAGLGVKVIADNGGTARCISSRANPKLNLEYLSADEFCEAVRKDQKPAFHRLSKAELDPNIIDRPLWQWRFLTEKDIWSWYQQVFFGGIKEDRPTKGPKNYPSCWKGPHG